MESNCTKKLGVAAAATRASVDPQIGCRLQPRNSGSVPTILPKGRSNSFHIYTTSVQKRFIGILKLLITTKGKLLEYE